MPDDEFEQQAHRSVWPPLPEGRLECYVRLWQLELWLRELVYLELKSRYGTAWSSRLFGYGTQPQKADARLTHMPTREQGPLSYITFSSLLKTIRKNRHLFAPYLPVPSIWNARMEEVTQIRNRVAHFRQGHENDLTRVRQTLKDIDKASGSSAPLTTLRIRSTRPHGTRLRGSSSSSILFRGRRPGTVRSSGSAPCRAIC